VVNLDAVIELDYVAAGFATVYEVVPVLNSAGVVSVNHGDLDVLDLLRAAFIHGGNLLHAFFGQPAAELGNAHNLWIVLLRDFNSVADVVAVTMGAKHDVNGFYHFFVRRTCRVSHYPGIYQNYLAFWSLNAEGCVSEPGDLDAVQFHAIVLFLRIMKTF
jgi:hypothetical protein